jgi:hypothetical protein
MNLTKLLLSTLCCGLVASSVLAEPVISEFLASNQTGNRDVDGDRNDWIEIFNPDTTPVNLAGWFLTDRATTPQKWAFPAVTIASKGYLVVWASEKNRAVAGQELHTNFKLDASGEYLALVRPVGTVAQEFAPTYPPQIPDVAYGVAMQETRTTLLGNGSPAKFHVPADASLGNTWQGSAFDDSTRRRPWRSVTLVLQLQ